jgi:hypothetical protein
MRDDVRVTEQQACDPQLVIPPRSNAGESGTALNSRSNCSSTLPVTTCPIADANTAAVLFPFRGFNGPPLHSAATVFRPRLSRIPQRI